MQLINYHTEQRYVHLCSTHYTTKSRYYATVKYLNIQQLMQASQDGRRGTFAHACALRGPLPLDVQSSLLYLFSVRHYTGAVYNQLRPTQLSSTNTDNPKNQIPALSRTFRYRFKDFRGPARTLVGIMC